MFKCTSMYVHKVTLYPAVLDSIEVHQYTF